MGASPSLVAARSGLLAAVEPNEKLAAPGAGAGASPNEKLAGAGVSPNEKPAGAGVVFGEPNKKEDVDDGALVMGGAPGMGAVDPAPKTKGFLETCTGDAAVGSFVAWVLFSFVAVAVTVAPLLDAGVAAPKVNIEAGVPAALLLAAGFTSPNVKVEAGMAAELASPLVDAEVESPNLKAGATVAEALASSVATAGVVAPPKTNAEGGATEAVPVIVVVAVSGCAAILKSSFKISSCRCRLLTGASN
jgi:hypothetical protein